MPTSSFLPPRLRRAFQLGLLACMAVTVSIVVGQSSPPLVDLATEPLYMNGAKAKANLTIALSVEEPLVGQTYRDEFDITKTYIGYFDPKACYDQNTGQNRFDWAGAPNANGSCGGGSFSGNFMNWATSSAIDILRYGLTGGNRVLDNDSGFHETVVERAWLPNSFYNNPTYFGAKKITKELAVSVVEQSLYGKITGTHLWIYNCRDRVYFATAADTTGIGTCDSPFGVSATSNTHPYLIGSTANQTYYEIRNLVCDPNSATNRLMTYNSTTKEWKGLCFQYPSGKYKPVGQLQVNSESLRLSVFGYLKDDTTERYGGVMRSPLKYVGPRAFDASFNLISGTNPRAEWNASTGKFIDNPQSGDATYGAQGYARSGAIMYINKFGTLNPDAIGSYKTYDPVSELYYEALRYLQAKQPTAEAVTGLNGNPTTVKALKENFPAYTTWTDPFTGFQDTTGDDVKSCLRNSILNVADVYSNVDHSVPGSAVSQTGDFTRSAEASPTLDAPFWTSVVGGFESHTSVTYTDSKGRAQTTSNLATNATYADLAGMSTAMTGAGTGSYQMAGLAYWANTQTFNPTYPKARVTTFSIDVNQNNTSADTTFRRKQQLYLAAKYGGFDDHTARTGSPYAPGSNVLWIGSDGDARNYFVVTDAQKFLDSLAEIFSRVVEETGSIAGGAISTTRLTSSESAAVYQARFNPVANYWSGRVLKYPISLAADGNSIVIGSTPTWEAGQVLTATAGNGASRNIVIGPPIGLQGTNAPVPFTWADLPQAHQDALNSTPSGVIDTLGERRLAFLRGDRTDEQSLANPTGIFRPRDMVLGDVVNSGLVFMGKPSETNSGTSFRTFYDANKNRKPVIFVNANDGMLHAFYDDTGAEAFAYVPGFLAPKLKLLPDQSYTHTSLADATPAVGDAFFRDAWHTTLVSGVGGGAQGVYALDVTNPETFTASKVLWEFTERDHPAMGNVVGAPQILKFRTNSGATTPDYKWFAVVASGVNNYAPDGYAHSGGDPSLFFLDLGFVPTAAQGWVEGTNFWRIQIPQTSTAIAKGLVGFSSVKNFATGAVDQLYAGDMQGNMWKLNFTTTGTSSLGANAVTNFTTFNPLTSDAAMYIAKHGTSLQPITGEPSILNSYGGKKVIAFGTGKFLETADTTVPLATTATFYAVMDDSGLAPVAGRTSLQAGTIDSAGIIAVPDFIWGTPATGIKSGWYFDFDASIAERQISDITALGRTLLFGSIYPTKGSCGEGGGKLYIVDPLTGDGAAQESQVGVLAAPLVVALGSISVDPSDTTGQRTARERLGVITQGAKGLKAITLSETYSSYSYQTGRISWRQINNYQATKAGH